MTQQYLRNLSLVVADPAGKGIELGALRVVFEVRRGDMQTPNSCDVRVYNLSDTTANRLFSPEFTQLSLKVGYNPQNLSPPPPLRQIFAGSIKQVRIGRENQKNSYVALTAADSDRAYNFSALSLTLAAGATPKNSVEKLLRFMAEGAISTPTGGTGGQELTQGYLAPLTTNAYTRGRTHYGMCRDEMRDVARSNDCKWWLQDGQLEMVPNTGYVPEPPILVTPSTGLVGVPEQTQNGLRVRMLLNPAIKIGRTIQLDATINKYRYGLDFLSLPRNVSLAQTRTRLDQNRLYYVMRAEHSGDTRGNPWYTELTCLATDITVPIGNVTDAAIVGPFPSPRDAVPRY